MPSAYAVTRLPAAGMETRRSCAISLSRPTTSISAHPRTNVAVNSAASTRPTRIGRCTGVEVVVMTLPSQLCNS